MVSGSRPGLEQGLAPSVVQFVGYVFALVAAVAAARPGGRRTGRLAGRSAAWCWGRVAVLVLLDLLVAARARTSAPASCGWSALVVIVVATVRLARGVAAAGRAR